jgi:hypothetical protein
VRIRRRVRREPKLELTATGPHQRKHRPEPSEHLERVGPTVELVLAAEAAALELDARPTRTRRVPFAATHGAGS